MSDVIANDRMYRNLTGKRFNWTTTGNATFASVLVGVSIVLGCLIHPGFLLMMMAEVVHLMALLFMADEGFFDRDDDYYWNYSSRLIPNSSRGKILLRNLGEIFDKYPNELSMITSKDLLFNEVWDQIEISNAGGDVDLYEYSMKIDRIKEACKNIRKETAIAGRSASTTMVDLALDAAKEYE